MHTLDWLHDPIWILVQNMWVYGRKFPDLRHRQQRMFRGDKWHKHKPETFFFLTFRCYFHLANIQTSLRGCCLLSHDMHLEYGSHFSNVRLLVLKLKTTFKNSMELKGLSRGQFASKWNIFKTFKKSSFSSQTFVLMQFAWLLCDIDSKPSQCIYN